LQREVELHRTAAINHEGEAFTAGVTILDFREFRRTQRVTIADMPLSLRRIYNRALVQKRNALIEARRSRKELKNLMKRLAQLDTWMMTQFVSL
jgi:hypothetical protein